MVTWRAQRGKLCRMGELVCVPLHYRGGAARMPARRTLLLAIAVIVVLLAGCTHRTRPSIQAGHRIAPIVIVDVTANDPQRANSVLIRAMGLVGLPPQTLSDYVPKIAAISATQVQAMARKYFAPKDQSIVVVGVDDVKSQLAPYGNFDTQ